MLHTILLSAPSGGEWLWIMLFIAFVIFFIFKSGQWFGQSRKERKP
ncbi:MAG: hypothetical protein WCG87_07530 [Bacteroidota bacterium]